MAIKVVKPGLSTTVQDLGRPGYYHIVIPISGGMDRLALRAANLLVANPEDAAVLEATFLGPELEFTSDATVAVAGAELPPKVDGGLRGITVPAGESLVMVDYAPQSVRLGGILSGLTFALTLLASAIWLRR